MKYLLHPRGVFWVKLENNLIKKDILYSVSSFFFLYILLLVITSIVVASGGNDITTSVSTSLATLGNIGPGFEKIGAAQNYAFFQNYIKAFLCFVMMVGRLEIFTVLVLFTPHFYRS